MTGHGRFLNQRKAAEARKCSLGFKCVDPSCKLRHPSCRDGTACPNPKCGFLHPDGKRYNLKGCVNVRPAAFPTSKTSAASAVRQQRELCWKRHKCSDPKCCAAHPPCSQGASCANWKCGFEHPDGRRYTGSKSRAHYESQGSQAGQMVDIDEQQVNRNRSSEQPPISALSESHLVAKGPLFIARDLVTAQPPSSSRPALSAAAGMPTTSPFPDSGVGASVQLNRKCYSKEELFAARQTPALVGGTSTTTIADTHQQATNKDDLETVRQSDDCPKRFIATDSSATNMKVVRAQGEIVSITRGKEAWIRPFLHFFASHEEFFLASQARDARMNLGRGAVAEEISNAISVGDCVAVQVTIAVDGSLEAMAPELLKVSLKDREDMTSLVRWAAFKVIK